MIVIGGGPAGILAAISASKKRRKGYNSCPATAILITVERIVFGKISASNTQQTGPHDIAKPAVYTNIQTNEPIPTECV